MNNEQKQIEEMAKDLDDCVSYDEWSAREYGEYTVDCDYTAYKLFSKGYRKLTENAVILTEKELLDNLNYHYDKGYKKGCKENGYISLHIGIVFLKAQLGKGGMLIPAIAHFSYLTGAEQFRIVGARPKPGEPASLAYGNSKCLGAMILVHPIKSSQRLTQKLTGRLRSLHRSCGRG